MSRLETALNGGINPERTRELLKQEWCRLGGFDELLAEISKGVRASRPAVDVSEAKRGAQVPPEWNKQPSLRLVQRKKAPTVVNRLTAVGLAIAQIDTFLAVDRPCIVEAFSLLETKKRLFAMGMEYMARHPSDREVGRSFQALQELLHERSLELAGSPDATLAMTSRPGPPIARLVRLVIAPLYWNGYDWSAIADLVDDKASRSGREARLRRLHESDPMLPIRKWLESRGRLDSQDANEEV